MFLFHTFLSHTLVLLKTGALLKTGLLKTQFGLPTLPCPLNESRHSHAK
jgi:hypothetical protein